MTLKDFEGFLWLLGIVALGVLLCMAGDYIRRRTDGRIRHAEVHLLAWLPVLALDVFILTLPHVSAMGFVLPLVIPAFVYFYWFVRFSVRRRSEEQIDAADETWRMEKVRRDRIEGYKHGSFDLRPIEPGGMTAPTASGRMSILASTPPPGPASARFASAPKWRGPDQDRNVLPGLRGWRVGAVVCMQLAMTASVVLSLMCALDQLLGISAPVAPVVFWISGAVDLVSVVTIVAVTRTPAVLVPMFAMAFALAGLLESFRIRMAVLHSPFHVYLAGRYSSLLVIVVSIVVLRWSLMTLWLRKRAT